MDNLENQSPSQPQAQLSALQAQLDSLRQLAVSMLVLLLVVSGTLNVFFLRQVGSSRTDLDEINRAFGPGIAKYQAAAPIMDEFERKLVEYAKTHPDFGVVLNKYKYLAKSGTPSPASAPAGGPPPAPGKK